MQGIFWSRKVAFGLAIISSILFVTNYANNWVCNYPQTHKQNASPHPCMEKLWTLVISFLRNLAYGRKSLQFGGEMYHLDAYFGLLLTKFVTIFQGNVAFCPALPCLITQHILIHRVVMGILREQTYIMFHLLVDIPLNVCQIGTKQSIIKYKKMSWFRQTKKG